MAARTLPGNLIADHFLRSVLSGRGLSSALVSGSIAVFGGQRPCLILMKTSRKLFPRAPDTWRSRVRLDILSRADFPQWGSEAAQWGSEVSGYAGAKLIFSGQNSGSRRDVVWHSPAFLGMLPHHHVGFSSAPAVRQVCEDFK